MNFNIDIAIVVVFLVVNLVAGLYSGRGITTIKQYAIGNRNFSTATLSATLIATWIGGGFFAIGVSQTYQDGLFYIVSSMGEIIALLVVAYIFATRMKEFLGRISLADVMGELYGKHVRVISAMACIAISTGAIALQLKVISSLFNHFFGFSSIYAVLASSFVIIIYSTFGGIKSVTFTDTIQFLTFGAFVPIFALFIWQALGNHETILANISNSPIFDYRELFNYHNPKFLPYLTIFIYSAALTPLDPSLFQRALLAKNTQQIRQSFLITAFIGVFILLASCSIGVIIYGHHPGLDPDNLVMYIIDNYSYTGLKGIVLVGILAITMSTADSWINVASVIFAHDFCNPLKIEFGASELFLSRLFSIFIGLFAIILALTAHNLLDLLLLIGNFFCPIVAPILFLGILGIRSTSKVALTAICSGILTTIIWRIYWQEETNIDSVMPGTIANLMVFLLLHYCLTGFKGQVKDKKDFQNLQNQTIYENKGKKPLKSFFTFIQKLVSFNLLEYCNKNASKNESIYIPFGVFTTLSMLCTTVLLDQHLYQEHIAFINIIQIVILGLSTFLIVHKIWSEDFKKKYLALIWYATMFISSAVASSFLILINNFSSMPLMLFSINLLVISYLLRWQETIVMLIGGITISYIICYYYFDTPVVYLKLYDSKFSLIYSLLMLTGSLIFFLKPKQEYLEATEIKVGTLESEVSHLGHEVTDLSEQVTHFSQRAEDQEKEIDRLGATAQKILNNVNHELRLPIGNVINFSEMLYETLEKSDNKLVKEMSKEVYDNSNRVSTMILNMLDLATLDVKKVDLQKKTINFGELVEDRVKRCRKIYLRDKKINFELTIEPEVMIAVDPNYIRQTVDNLVINAINFSTEGLIKVSVLRKDRQVIFTVADQGKGIPKNELSEIFNPFKMGSNSESKACGRGVGLALCKSAVEAHGGSISADSNGEIGATLKFTLPLQK
jgi:Na+/proline symporter/signal transduction histidine kinase